MGSPKQRGEHKQTICRRREAGDGPYAALDVAQDLVSYNTPTVTTDSRGGCDRDVQWLTVAVHALEVQRYLDDPPAGGRVVALSQDEINQLVARTSQNPQVWAEADVIADASVPAIQRASRFSLLQALVIWEDDTFGQLVRRFDIAGGFTASFPSASAEVKLVLPALFDSVSNSSSIPQDQRGGIGTEAAPVSGLILDTIAEASVTMSCAGVGKNTGRCSYPLVIPAGVAQLVEAPPGVRAVVVNAPDGVTAGFEADPSAPYGVTFPVNETILYDGSSRYVRVNNTNGAPAQARVIFELEF